MRSAWMTTADASGQVTGRLVGQQQRRIVSQRPRDGRALLPESYRAMVQAVGQTQQTSSSRAPLRVKARAARELIGSATFSSAVSVGMRLKNWKMNPIR